MIGIGRWPPTGHRVAVNAGKTTRPEKCEFRQTPNAGTHALRSRLMKFTGALVKFKPAVKLPLIE